MAALLKKQAICTKRFPHNSQKYRQQKKVDTAEQVTQGAPLYVKHAVYTCFMGKDYDVAHRLSYQEVRYARHRAQQAFTMQTHQIH